MAADNTLSRRVAHPHEAVVRHLTALDRGWQATVLGLCVVGSIILLQAI